MAPRASAIQNTDLGTERRCPRCREFWPATTEFFYPLSVARLHSYCKACFSERQRELRQGFPKKRIRRHFVRITRLCAEGGYL